MKLQSAKLPPQLKSKIPEIYFDNKGAYWMRISEERFLPVSGSQIIEEMQLQLINTEIKSESGLSLGNEVLALARRGKFVDYAGPLAGHKCGYFETRSGRRVLVSNSCTPVPPGKSTKIPRFEKFLAELLGSQHVHFLGWLKMGYESLVRGDFMPGQLLVLCGPSGCGKTFLQWCITELFGGRSARPYRYMTGKTQFNADLAQAEHLTMGDVAADYQITARKQFAAQIKEFCVEPEMAIHAKGKDATLALPTFRRVSLSVNDEPEHMMIVPPLDADMSGKIMLLRCSPAVLDKDRNVNQERFGAELPALARFLMEFKVPQKLRDDRFGIRAFHEPSLLDMVADLTPENQLLAVIDDGFWRLLAGLKGDADVESWNGSAEELKTLLLQTQFRETASRLLDWPAACGTYLARLGTKYPARFRSTRVKGRTRWYLTKG